MSDRPLLQSLIDAAVAAGDRDLVLPSGSFVVDRAAPAWWCLRVPPTGPGLRVVGHPSGTAISLADGSPGSTRVWAIQGAGSSLSDVVLLGGSQSDADEHRAGAFVMAPGVLLRGVEARGFTGDGIYLYSGADRAEVSHCLCSGNLRNGITLGADLEGVRVSDCLFLGNGAQQFDIEPGVGASVRALRVDRCVMDAMGASSDYVMTLGGSSAALPGRDQVVTWCVVNGPVLSVWGDRVTLMGCSGVNRTAKPSLTVYRTSHSVRVIGCDFESTDARVGLAITGTGSGSCPERVLLQDTRVAVRSGTIGVSMSGMMSADLRGLDVSRTGDRVSGSVGITVRAVNPTQDADLVRIDGCSVSGFDRGVLAYGNTWTLPDGTRINARLDRLEVSRTSVIDASAGLHADDGTGVVRTLVLGPDGGLGAVTHIHSGTLVVTVP